MTRSEAGTIATAIAKAIKDYVEDATKPLAYEQATKAIADDKAGIQGLPDGRGSAHGLYVMERAIESALQPLVTDNDAMEPAPVSAPTEQI
jgi:hypothetical protein